MLYRVTLWSQTIYYVVTALWALADIKSFMAVTGAKTDIWLVKTVAVLLLAISISFIVALILKEKGKAIMTLAITCCLVLVFIDCYYSLNGTISEIYFLDALAEFLLLILWLIIIIGKRKQRNSY